MYNNKSNNKDTIYFIQKIFKEKEHLKKTRTEKGDSQHPHVVCSTSPHLSSPLFTPPHLSSSLLPFIYCLSPSFYLGLLCLYGLILLSSHLSIFYDYQHLPSSFCMLLFLFIRYTPHNITPTPIIHLFILLVIFTPSPFPTSYLILLILLTLKI